LYFNYKIIYYPSKKGGKFNILTRTLRINIG